MNNTCKSCQVKNLYIDFDGVIVDTIPVMYKGLKEAGIDSRDEVLVRGFYANMDWKKMLEETPIINDSINDIKKIIDSNRFEVTILTHVNSLNEGIEKVKYLRQYFKDITIIPVPKAISKTKMVHTEDAILIDDYSGNLIEWEDEGGIGIRFNIELEDKGFKVINKLDQLLDIEFN